MSLDELIVIEIFGEEYKFKPDKKLENPEKIVRRLKRYIKESELIFQNSRSDKNKMILLMLAAMKLSKDFHELEVKYTTLEKDMERRVSSLLGKFDEGSEQYINNLFK
jgi:cell division protein ZapA (FtsZ GTPase activity inhibitor)